MKKQKKNQKYEKTHKQSKKKTYSQNPSKKCL
jgi:hypothetical protein